MNADQADRTSVWQSEGVPGTYQKRRNYGVLGRLDYDADSATISSLTAYRETVVGIAAHLGGPQAPFPFLAQDSTDDRHPQLSQEMRFTSPESSADKWEIGR